MQNTFPVLDGLLFEDPEKRLNAKKDTLRKLIANEALKESQFGFERYTIICSKNNLTNISIGIQSYGSSWEDEKYYLFDTENSVNIGSRLFINSKKLLNFCYKKLKVQDDVICSSTDLSQYFFEIDTSGNVSGITFVFNVDQNFLVQAIVNVKFHFPGKRLKSLSFQNIKLGLLKSNFHRHPSW
ncbi:hypothetical protein [Chryseobacterium foetidum]|uniref:hypothetical protein n=1 Tax=Chryseobacterium foetidum TaxID=2951057 RepID=UPI0021C7DAB0|nr:hypothetical protein [Chryseobacterium foetidum]